MTTQPSASIGYVPNFHFGAEHRGKWPGEGSGGGETMSLETHGTRKEPTCVILTETRHGNDVTGKNLFSGYKLMQYTETEQRAAGVIVFCKKGDITLEQNSEIRSNQGNYTIAVYNKEGQLFVFVAIYGPPPKLRQGKYTGL